MKHLLGLGAAVALVVAGSAYAGGYGNGYNCHECSDEITIELVGEVECSCEITFITPLAFQALSLVDFFETATQVLSVDCNTDDDLNIEFTSLNGGLLRDGGTELVDYSVLLGGGAQTFGVPVLFDGEEPVAIRINDVDELTLLAGTYRDTVTVTVFVD